MSSLTPPVQSWPGLMTLEQAAAYWSVSPRAFQRLLSAGVVKPRKLGPRTIRYSRAEMDAAAENLPHGRGQSPTSGGDQP